MSAVCLGCGKDLGTSRRAHAGHIYHCQKFREYQQQTLGAAVLTGSSGTWDPPEELLSCRYTDEVHDELMGMIPFQEEAPDQSQVRTGAGLTIIIPPVGNYMPMHSFLT